MHAVRRQHGDRDIFKVKFIDGRHSRKSGKSTDSDVNLGPEKSDRRRARVPSTLPDPIDPVVVTIHLCSSLSSIGSSELEDLE
jgi:hypothetical protein